MIDGLDWPHDFMDKVVWLITKDTKFLAKCLRKGITPEVFVSEVRKTIVRIAFGYFDDYQKAPSDDLMDLVADNLAKRHDDDDISEQYAAYLSKLYEVSTLEIDPDYITSRLEEFIKKRVVENAVNNLIKLKDLPTIDYDRHIELMRDAIGICDAALSDNKAEAITEDPIVSDRTDVASRFNVSALDQALGGGLKFGNYVIVLAYTNVGKTWCIAHLAKMAARFGNPVLVIENELSNRKFRERLKMCLTGMNWSDMNENPVKTKKIIKSSMVKKSNIYLLSEEEKGMRVSDIPSVIADINDRFSVRVKTLLIDSADDMQPPIGRYKGDLEANTATHTWLKNYARNEDMCIVTSAQSQRRGEERWWLTSGTVGENINKVRKATVGVSLNASPGEIAAGYIRLLLFKHTDGPVGVKTWIKTKFNIGQFCCDHGLYVHDEYFRMLKDVGKTDKEIWKSGASGKKSDNR